jgi:hypothetical protein
VPENLASDSYAYKVVKGDVQEELTQARSRIKKMVRVIFSFVQKTFFHLPLIFTDQGQHKNII